MTEARRQSRSNLLLIIILIILLLALLLFLAPPIARAGGPLGGPAAQIAYFAHRGMRAVCGLFPPGPHYPPNPCRLPGFLGYEQGPFEMPDPQLPPFDLPIGSPNTPPGACGDPCSPGEWCVADGGDGTCDIWCIDTDADPITCEGYRCPDFNHDHICDGVAWTTCSDSGPGVVCSDHDLPQGTCADGYSCGQSALGGYTCWADTCNQPSGGGACGTPCDPAAPNCAAGLSCVGWGTGTWQTPICWAASCAPPQPPGQCADPCDPAAPNCAAGLSCVGWGTGTWQTPICWAESCSPAPPPGQCGDPCSFSAPNCAPGLECTTYGSGTWNVVICWADSCFATPAPTPAPTPSGGQTGGGQQPAGGGGTCGAACADSSQCGTATRPDGQIAQLACFNGVCWDSCACGGEGCAEDTGGGPQPSGPTRGQQP